MKMSKRWLVLPTLLLVVFAGWVLARFALDRGGPAGGGPVGAGSSRPAADARTPEELAAALARHPPRVETDAILRRLVAGGSGSVGPLKGLLDDEDRWLRALVARALYRMGPPAAAAAPDLIKALHDEDDQVRIWSAGALGEIGLPAAGNAIEPLVAAMKTDESPGVRRSAARALGTLGPGAQAAVGPLIEALKDPDVTVHPYAAEALGSLGAADERVVPALKGATNDTFANLRAVEALKKLGAEVPASATGPATRPAGDHPTTGHTHGQ